MPRAKRQYDELEKRLADFPTITGARRSRWKATPTARRIRDPSAYAKQFSGRYAHRDLDGGIGHNLPQEAPHAFTQAIIDADGFSKA